MTIGRGLGLLLLLPPRGQPGLVGLVGRGGRRWYAAAADGKAAAMAQDVDPEDGKAAASPQTVQGAEPDGSSGTRALVPMTVIYLPPPAWHRPAQPYARIQRPQPMAAAPACPVGAASGPDATAGSGRTSEAPPRGRGALMGRLARMLWPQRQRPARAGAAADAAAPQAEAERLSRATAEKWQGSAAHRVLGAWRRATTALQAVPRDQDWVAWAGAALNEITGYRQVAQLKVRVEASSHEFQVARQRLDAAKAQHRQATQDRIANQREISSLLQRKHLWQDDDVARFTDLYRQEHQAEAAEQQSARELKEAESLVDRRYDALVGAIRERYHEEQIWSDKIRRASTYGTWAVLLANIAALLMAQAIFEPRKRRKIVDGVDERLAATAAEQRAALDRAQAALAARLARQEAAAEQAAQRLQAVSLALAALPPGPGAALEHQAAVDPAQLLRAGGCSDTELDLYYGAAGPAEHPDRKTHTRAEARRLALGGAALGLAAGVLLHWLGN
ncbi:sensitivity to high expression protein she9 [Coemansia javaensis]|uniref:Sensitive to high expression protein 9, mitochondrial n=1 Tax=Coemansia javaensis TaxID=2761396 RepID=A0A9W8HDN0_9FUNG|nr:sensitivity to high expression protein she9 [Coemansia javaensis]